MSFYKDFWSVNCFAQGSEDWENRDGVIQDRESGDKGVDGCMGVLLAFLITMTKYLTKRKKKKTLKKEVLILAQFITVGGRNRRLGHDASTGCYTSRHTHNQKAERNH